MLTDIWVKFESYCEYLMIISNMKALRKICFLIKCLFIHKEDEGKDLEAFLKFFNRTRDLVSIELSLIYYHGFPNIYDLMCIIARKYSKTETIKLNFINRIGFVEDYHLQNQLTLKLRKNIIINSISS